jgi:hypothetical protein
MSVWQTNRFWSVSLELTILFVKMRLAISFTGKKNRIVWTYRSKIMGV